MKRPALALAALALVASPLASAETIYRCGNEYSTAPCAGARTIVVADAVTAEQRAEAREVARREKALAAEMTRDRREQEALLKPTSAGSLSAPRVAAAPPSTAAKKHPKKHGKKAAPVDDERDFIASVPKAKKSAN